MTPEQLEAVQTRIKEQVDLWADDYDYWLGYGEGCQFALDVINEVITNEGAQA